jgi:diguanylate cyclase (GGDEF)-like protein
MRMVKANQGEIEVPVRRGAVARLRPAAHPAAHPSARFDEETRSAFDRVRQSFLDALPVAAAVVYKEEGLLEILDRNVAFDGLEQARSSRTAVLLLAVPEIAESLSRYFGGDRPSIATSFDWRDGDAVSGRHFCVTIAPLAPVAGYPPRCLLSLIDRTSEIESARSLRAELLHDSLTGLPNRSAFAEAVDEMVERGEGRGHAVLLVDLSRFSRVNESLGAMAGDEVIITVARRLISTLRAGDLLARVGGDEFGVLVKVGDRPDEAVVAARRIQQVLAAPFRLARFEIGLECAIGCALVGQEQVGEQAGGEEMVRNAQLALKRAKASGRIEVHNNGEAACARYKLDIETELRRAIEQDELHLAYQPIVDLGANRVVGFEALSRWNHPLRGPIDPAEFIPVAEEAGLIVPLGRWALDRALATLAVWDKRAGGKVPLNMSVNVSAIQLARDDVPGVIAGTLAAHGITGDRLTIELTESAIVLDPERTTRALQALKALNVRVAMDDFGTGYSSLSYLRKLPIDILKIDRSFVSGMLADRDKVAIVRAVLSLADALGKQTTAEGIETIELSQTLAALGCTHGQGYFYAQPLLPDAAFDYWRERSA